MIDDIDQTILSMLQSNARTTNADIARSLGLAPSAILERIRKLEQRGVIRGYHAELNPDALDQSMTAFVLVRTHGMEMNSLGFADLVGVDEIQEVHEVAGEDCLMVKLHTRDTSSLNTLLKEKIKSIPGIVSTKTVVVLDTYKETSTLKIPKRE